MLLQKRGAGQWRVLVTLLFSIVMIILFDRYFVLGLLVVGLVYLEADWVVVLECIERRGVKRASGGVLQ